MKQLLFPIQLNETSARVQYLHLALAALGMPVDEKEKLSRTAGKSTIEIVRGLQRNLKLAADESVVLDAATAAAIEKEFRQRGIVDDSCLFTVSGSVRTADGYTASKVKLVAVDIDLRGAAVYRTISSYAEVLKNKGFELLGEAASDRNGQYNFSFYCDQFKNAERAKADVVVFAVKDDTIYGRSRMVNAGDYSETGEVHDVDIIISEPGEETEYQRVMSLLQTFLRESGVALHELAASREQVVFTGEELELDQRIIDIAAKAQEIVVKEDDRLSHELLYALGRMQHPLVLIALSRKSTAELEAAVKSAMADNIIRQHKPKEIRTFLDTLAEKSDEAALGQQSQYQKLNLDEILAQALPEKELRVSFMHLVKDFQGEAKDFWTKFLPEQPGFKGKPELVKSLLFTQQLTMVTGNHQLLVKEIQADTMLNSTTDLLRLPDKRLQELIKKAGLPEGLETTDDSIKEYAAQIRNVLNAAYPTQRIALMLEKKELPVSDSLAKTIQRFLAKHEDFSFTDSRVFDFEKEIEKTATKDAQAVKDELLRMQRVFQVSTTPETMNVLMKNNFNSAHDIVSTPRMSFLQAYGEELGGVDTAYAVYQKAAYINSRAEMNAMALMEMSHRAVPQLAMSQADHAMVMEVIGKKIPNYTDLFGSPDICECGHCRSVFGPAAYFVDLLRFLWRGVKNDDGKSPLEMLVKRRPDLLYLPLTCENTDTLIPYIDLANEIMEFYTVHGSIDNFRGFDTGGTTAAELRADPQHVNMEAYRKLKDAPYPFSLPYHRPLDTIRISSNHLKTDRHEVMKTMQRDFSEKNNRAIAAESLQISPEEYLLFTKEDFDGNADPRPLHTLYGYTAAAQVETMAQVPVFLERSGIKYTDLAELLKTKFINPHQHIVDFIQQVFISSSLSPTEIYSILEQIDDGSLDPADHAALMEALTASDITAAGFQDYIQQHFTHFNAAITLFEPSSKCDLDTTVLRVLGNVYKGKTSSGLKADDWSRIHRFIRLWRKLGWSIHELDLMLAALGATDITPALIHDLSAATELHRELKRPMNQLTTFWGEIDTYGPKSLYKKLFLNKATLSLDPSFAPDEQGNFLSTAAGVLADHVPAILAAYKITQEDLDAILSVAVVVEGGNRRQLNLQTDTLNLANLSIIYRYTDFGKALKFKIPECCTLISLFNTSPFSIYDIDQEKFTEIDPTATFEFYKLAAAVKESGFKPAVLRYIFSGTLPAESSLGLNPEKIKITATTIRQTFAAIEQDHSENPPQPVTTELITNKLALTFSDEIVLQFVDIVEGNISYALIAPGNLTLNIPASLTEKCSYVKASGRLTWRGAMTDAERTALKALNADSNYKAAVDAIYALPEDFLRAHFNGVFTDMDAALAVLINRPAQPNPAGSDEKWRHVYSHYIPLLKKRLREDAIAQHVAALIGLSEDATRLLIGADMPALLVDLATVGASGAYFSDTSFSSEVLRRTEAGIDFQWKAAGPGAPVPGGAFSARWETFLSAPATAEYTLLVNVTEADESFRLYVDEAMILEKPAGDARLKWEVLVPLNASQLHQLRLDYIQQSGASGVQLLWKTATSALEAIPATALFPADLITRFSALSIQYHRAAQCINGFAITEKELDHFTRNSVHFGNIDWKAITPLHWRRLNDYTALRKSLPLAQADLIDLFGAASTTNPAPVMAELITTLVLATAWDVISTTYLITTHFGFGPADFTNEKAIIRLRNAMTIIRSSGISAAAVAGWGSVQTDFDALHDTAQQIKSVVKAKYEEEDWLDVSAKLSDAAREHQKQALISYLLVQPALRSWGVRDADALFEYFLIDVQMGACMDTSRIVQATAAIQQFVNRCLLNLETKTIGGNEKGVSPDAIDTERWEWMKNYRVWEANRKVFLYPENWLEPDWRDDRSAFFKELESELVQNDINGRSVETAFRNYLTRLNEVANLEVCGMFQENDEQGKLHLLHVFGRTHNAPYQVFYRTWNKYRKWSAWEKVQADIRNIEDGDASGVHLLPFVWKKRLFLFWTELIEKKESSDTAKNKSAKAASESGTLGGLEPKKYWETRLAWTEWVDGKWIPKQLSKEFLHQYIGTVIPNASRIKLVGNVDAENRLTINTHCEFDGAWVELGSFILADITSKIQAVKLTAMHHPYYENKWSGYGLSFMNYKKTGKLSLRDDDYLRNSVAHKLLLSPERKNYIPRLSDPFFFSDADKTYFVRPVDIRVPGSLRRPELTIPFIPKIVDDSYFTHPQFVPKLGPEDLMPHGNLFSMPKNMVETGVSSFAKTLPADAVREAGTVILRSTGPARVLAGRTGSVSGRVGAVLERAGNLSGRAGSTAGGAANASGSAANAVVSSNNIEHIKYDLKQIGTVGAAFGGLQFEIYPGKWQWNYRWDKGLEFHTFHHPHSNSYVTRLNRYGMAGLLNTDTALFFSDGGSTFVNRYNPDFSFGRVQKPTDFPKRTYFKENICFDAYGANSIYNWELFFHAPMYIATRLSKNGKYKEAMDWFHYIFDPTTNAVPLPGESEISRYWKVLPFKTTPAENLEDWFLDLQPNNNPATENMVIGEWADKPFMPHLMARNRPIAYMKNVVIKYVENLLDWADSLFRQFTRESVNEALQLYVIANHILGPKPQFVPRRGNVRAETYSSLRGKLDDFSNAIVQLENLFPYSSDVPATAASTGPNLLGVGESLYFCIPSNEKLMECWDRAADRLFKIRHCMDINGVERQLALFAPPIDPAALIQAASQGLSLGSILADLSSPPPIYRFTFLLQKANEFCAEVKMLGNALLAALEKKDNEAMGRLRAGHERSMLDMITGIRERQVLEAKANRSALEKARETVRFRMEHYNALLGNEAIAVPSVAALPAEIGVESMLPPDSQLPVLVPDVDQSLVESGESGVRLISKEKQELDLGLASMIVQQVATGIEGVAGTMNFIPTFSAEIEPFGCGMSISFGGSNIAGGMSGIAKLPLGVSAVLGYMAAHSAKMANYIRREQEWTFQANMALKEIVQLEKQITAADIRIQVAQKELDNHLSQIENAKEVELFLQNKFTNQELYQWMKEQLFAVYKQSYNMCYDLSKKAEKAYRYETGNELASFIQYGYWDNAYQGLLAGEKMQLALRQLEKSYIEENKRELELRKNVSLAFVNPLALQELRQTGRCFVNLPEELFDMDFQGHYFRRIKAVSLSIPCIAGPMTTISCSLRLIKNSVRINTSLSGDGKYEHMNDEGVWIDDDRFRSSNVPVQAIAVSHAQHDSGLFELNFRDERYLPFEGSGAISEWKIELTADDELRQFDYNTISDVVMHLNYTAREDAGLFKTRAVESIKNYLTNAAENSKQPLVRMFSLRHEFPTDWHAFLYPSAAGDDQQIRLQLKRDHFPFFARNRTIDVMKVEVLARARKAGDYHVLFSATDTAGDPLNATQLNMPENDTYGGMQRLAMSGTTGGVSIEDIDAFGPLSLKLKHNGAADFKSLETDPEELEDVFLVIHYKLSD